MVHHRQLALIATMLVSSLALQVRAQTDPPSGPSAPAAAPGNIQASEVPPGYVVIDPATGRPMAAAQRRAERPDTLPYHEGAPIPPGYTLEESHYNGLIIGGIVPLGALYVLSLSVASGNNFKGPAGWLAVPVVGPFGWLAAHKSETCNYDVCDSSDDSVTRSFVTMDGLFQAAGAALFVTGLAITRKQWVLTDPNQLYVVPYSTSTAHGISILGRF